MSAVEPNWMTDDERRMWELVFAAGWANDFKPAWNTVDDANRAVRWLRNERIKNPRIGKALPDKNGVLDPGPLAR